MFFSGSLATAVKIECVVEQTYGQWWQSRHRTMLRGVLGKTFRLVGYTIQYGCIAHCAFEYVGGVVMCSGPSMEPTIQNSDIVFAENLSRHFYGIQRGDIVIAKSPSDPKSNICKRVIGLEGDKILTNSPSDFFKSHSYVPTGHVWLEGDNLQNSTDSRYYGPIPYGLIRGRIFFKIWPLSDFGFLRDSPNGHRFSDD
ncbi:mitochondrial inner membrane protease subunit 1 isoform X2 [Ursus americanus]|uniref:Mitochondrial inner membrane protease subunit n=2 Tax=Ursus TaxID=9639 RepID=A0A384BR95_URSMA|nr:mitochondrial inner membrane protease subunit 1 isoform X1 [Ursus maritimus]XP_008685084.1 mitochondrial inner membrane protease subunit 1 isoform X1 [Ursus maritimus]XP_008685085.1 mitochondrial inner membrane protease subunit 1 isoform X1 [Ursus maritimus]XP_008685086.1 mitochondrial inner membrane protease subunit 1 isoform X1 [Ursus maritimus]XP_008685087.1 mitochondrial inner membrane protease subunit 1 isoform X1 [Ursus maritimus]XP_026367964.1 mitochondrial inner membrane protease su